METTLSLDKPCLYPGDVVRCKLKVSCTDPSVSSGRLDLTVECYGSERIDPGWVGPLYRPDVPATKDGRRLSRNIFHTGSQKVLAGAPECSPFTRTFSFRVRLPSRIPPSYRGTAVAFQYHIHARASFQPDAGEELTSEAHALFQVWPLGERPLLERRSSIPTPTGGPPGAAAAGGGGGAAGGGPGSSSSAAAAAGGGGGGGEEEEPDVTEYRVGLSDVKCRWEEVAAPPAGSSALQSYPSGPFAQPPTPSGAIMRMGSLASTCEGPPFTAGAPGGGPRGAQEGEQEEEGGSSVLRQLTPLQLAHMAPRSYNLKAGDQPLVRITIQTPVDGLLQPGGTVGVLLDFRAAHGPAQKGPARPSCLQVVALLESREVVHAPYTYTKNQDSASMRKLYSEQQDVTAHLLTSQFIFSIPPHAPVSFKTPLISHKWALRFELSIQHGAPPGKAGRQQPVQQQLAWSLPLLVFPPPQIIAT